MYDIFLNSFLYKGERITGARSPWRLSYYCGAGHSWDLRIEHAAC